MPDDEMTMIAYLRFRDVRDGQLVDVEQPLTTTMLGGAVPSRPALHLFARKLRDSGLTPPEDPVVLCWHTLHQGYLDTDATGPPVVWDAWKGEPPPADVRIPGAQLLVVGRAVAQAACEAWPSTGWSLHWHPTAAWREAADSVGVTARLIGGPGDSRLLRLRPEVGATLKLPDPDACKLDRLCVTYNRDAEPSGLAADGSALYGYRIAS